MQYRNQQKYSWESTKREDGLIFKGRLFIKDGRTCILNGGEGGSFSLRVGLFLRVWLFSGVSGL